MTLRCKRSPDISPHVSLPVSSTWTANEHQRWSSQNLVLQQEEEGWCIKCNDEVVFVAISLAMHPVTVHPDEWYCNGRPCPLSFDHVPMTTSKEFPVDMDILGLDYFNRKRPISRILWFRTPDGEVYHSGAKGSPPGKRYCHFCRRVFSANNFSSQHMRKIHRPQSLELVFGDSLL